MSIILPSRKLWTPRSRQRGFFLAPGRFGAAASDPYYANVVAHLPLNGANGSTVFTDLKGKTWTGAGGAQISTAQSKWGGSSLALDGGGDWITTGAHADFAMGTGDFDLAAWVWVDSSGDHPLFSVASTTGTVPGWILFARHTSGSGRCRFFNCATGTGHNGTNVITTAGWHFFQMRRIAGLLEVRVDGAAEISQAIATDFTDTQYVYLGASRGPSPATHGDLYVNDFRLTKGVGRAFVVPTAPFPTS